MKILIKESQLKNLLKKEFSLDLTGKIEIITSSSQVPYEFDNHIDSRYINRYLNEFGPMYLFTITKRLSKEMFLYQKRNNNNIMIINSNDFQISENDFMRKLGIDILGLSVENLIDEYFTEEPLNEQVTDEPEDNMTKIIQSYLDMNLPNYYGIKRFWVDYNEQFDSYDINIFFDRQIVMDMGGGTNMLLRNAKYYINEELNSVFNGAKFSLYEHYED